MKVVFRAALRDINLVSTNRKFKANPYYINAKEHLIALFKAYRGEAETVPRIRLVKVELLIYTNKDIDNCDKIIHDALEGAGVVENDKQISIKHTYKIPAPRASEREKIIITVSTLSEREKARLLTVNEKLNEIEEVNLWEI